MTAYALKPFGNRSDVLDPNSDLEYVEVDQGGPAEGGAGAALRSLWSMAYRNRLLIGSVLALSVLAAVLVTLLTTPIYQAQAIVEIDQQADQVLANSTTVSPGSEMQDADRMLQTQMGIIQSRSVAQQVVDSLGLAAPNSAFFKALNLQPAGGGAVTPGTNAARREQVAIILQRNLEASLPRNSRLATIAYSSPDPVLAARIANSYIESFITGNLQRKFDSSSYARAFLVDQLGKSRIALEDSERALNAYARASGLIDANATVSASGDQAGRQSITNISLVQLNASLSQAKADMLTAKDNWEAVRNVDPFSVTDVLENRAVQELLQQRSSAQTNYLEERKLRKPEYPTVQQAAAQLDEINKELNGLAQGVIQSIERHYKTAQNNVTSLTAQVDRLKSASLSEQDSGVRYNILTRAVDTNRNMYQALLQRYQEVSAAAGVTSNNISVVDRATVTRHPISPRPLLNVLIALLGGICLALGLAFAREKLDDSVRSADDVSSKLLLPFLGSVPVLTQDETPAAVLEDPRTPLSEAYAALRIALAYASPEGLPKSLLFTSALPSEGKSTSCYAIARDIARSGARVVLVDADLRRPSLAPALGLTNRMGLSDVLSRQKSISEVIQASDIPNLDFIACGPPPPNPVDLLSGGQLDQFVAELSERYRHVIIDGPPVMGLADAALLTSAVSGTIMVVEANRAHRGQAKSAIRRLRAVRSNILGVILTKYDTKQIGYGYGSGYEYSYSQPQEITG